MATINSTSCCGLREIEGMHKEPKEILLDVGRHRYEYWNSCALYFFTDTASGKYGKMLAKYIEENGLGSITKSDNKRNPNSGRIIICWVWSVNKAKFKKWYEQNKI